MSSRPDLALRPALRVVLRAGALAACLAIVLLPVASGDAPSVAAADPASSGNAGYTADGRSTLAELMDRYRSLSANHGWKADTVFAYPGDPEPAIRAWRTPHSGEALWVLAGIHGEEPAGPNAIARSLASIVELADSGVPVVVIPLCNPKAYRNNWRYPNTAERDWRKGGYSVGDAEYLLPDTETGTRPRAVQPTGPETRALTDYVLELSRSHPPRLVLDLHEDELSTEGGYIYSQGTRPDASPVGAEISRLLQASGIPIRQSGRTRFDEPIVNGVITRDVRGQPIRDGSIDELLAATEIFVDGVRVRGPSARTVIVVETPAFAGSEFERRVAAHSAVIQRVRELWRLESNGSGKP